MCMWLNLNLTENIGRCRVLSLIYDLAGKVPKLKHSSVFLIYYVTKKEDYADVMLSETSTGFNVNGRLFYCVTFPARVLIALNLLYVSSSHALLYLRRTHYFCRLILFRHASISPWKDGKS